MDKDKIREGLVLSAETTYFLVKVHPEEEKLLTNLMDFIFTLSKELGVDADPKEIADEITNNWLLALLDKPRG